MTAETSDTARAGARPRTESARLFARALELLPGGVDSPVRAFGAVGGEPLFFERGRGARVWDADGNEYIDWMGSWGPLILGHADSLLVDAGSGALTLGIPGTPGVTRGAAGDTLVAEYNDLASVQRLLEANTGTVAAVIVEPVAGNMGVIAPAAGFLEGLRTLTDAHGALLIFDEVITGFRVAPGGAQHLYGIRPDLTVLGKIIGGGLPVGAYGGRRELMELVAPAGPVYQAGTLSGNPAAMAAGIATLRALAEAGVYERLEQTAAALAAGLDAAAQEAGVALTVNRVGSLLTPFFVAGPVAGYAVATGADTARFGAFFRGMLAAGVYLPPSQFEAWFVSSAHGDAEVEATLAAARQAMSDAQ